MWTGDEIQCQFKSHQGGSEQLDMVDILRQGSPYAIPITIPNTQHDHRVRCLQYGVECSTGQTAHRGEVVSRGSFTPHKYYSCLSGTQCFAKHCQGITIQLKLDTVTAVTYINKLGGTHSHTLCQLAITIWEWCIQRNILLLAEHLPGKDNVAADQESSSMRDQCNWMLHPQVFNQIQVQMDLLQIDLFASRLTERLPFFYSWIPDPEAQGTDAFNQDWSQMRGFANPPWCLIACCLSQVRRQAASVVILTPLWPSQP